MNAGGCCIFSSNKQLYGESKLGFWQFREGIFLDCRVLIELLEMGLRKMKFCPLLDSIIELLLIQELVLSLSYLVDGLVIPGAGSRIRTYVAIRHLFYREV
ncbi:MAG: hypothetical protein G01um101416_901 [Microgenomates group bacterium Gr01-1014_16]|nr:MAG: hypothetical protein G01um101416_901 [Microgenomates group bacterium Gr01-1014_16]